MNLQTTEIRQLLLQRYYRSTVLGWFQPKSLHWAKYVDRQGRWRWTPADRGMRGRLLRDPPIHLYQTLLRFKSRTSPKGYGTEGLLLGGPILFEADIIDRGPISLWEIADSARLVNELLETLSDCGEYRISHVMFSGFRGIHVIMMDPHKINPIPLKNNWRTEKSLRQFKRERKLLARSIGEYNSAWDWRVSADIWRVTRVPGSIHGESALRTMILKPPYTWRSFQDQLRNSCPFSLERQLRIRTTKSIPSFTFIDGESFGPYREGWATRLPLGVALHLIWQDMAKPREVGPSSAGSWFKPGWQNLFGNSANKSSMSSQALGEAVI